MIKEIKIGPYTWSINDEEDLSGKNVLGNCCFDNLEIKISNTIIKEDVKKAVILHELCHSLFYSGGFTFSSLKQEEAMCDFLANQLLLFLQQNPKFFKEMDFIR